MSSSMQSPAAGTIIHAKYTSFFITSKNEKAPHDDAGAQSDCRIITRKQFPVKINIDNPNINTMLLPPKVLREIQKNAQSDISTFQVTLKYWEMEKFYGFLQSPFFEQKTKAYQKKAKLTENPEVCYQVTIIAPPTPKASKANTDEG